MIELQNVSWKVDQFALKDVSCVIPDGKYAVLMGATGCGKTTVLEIICGLRRPEEGIKLIAGFGELLTGTMLLFDGRTMDFRKVVIQRRPGCSVCGSCEANPAPHPS